ncbi:hypothetical protein D3C74_01560 [compost metagenome]
MKKPGESGLWQKRFGYAGGVAVAIGLGLASRYDGLHLPALITAHAGDALWAVMIYFGIRTLWPQGSRCRAALMGLLFCYVIEASQLIQLDWLNAIRSTTLGALVLGRGFLVEDLIRYTVGIGLAYLLDWRLSRSQA